MNLTAIFLACYMAIFAAINPPQFSLYHTDNIEINGTGYEYLDALAANENTIIGTSVDLTNIDYYEQTVEMGVLGDLALQLAASAFTGGLGLAGWQAAVVGSVFKDVGAGVITGDLDMGELVQNAAFSYASSVVSTQIGDAFGSEGLQLSQESPIGATNGLLSDYKLAVGVTTTVTDAALNSAIYGTSLGDNLSNGLQGFALNQALAVTQFGIGEIRGAENSLIGTLMHAGAGCAFSTVSGGECANGAISATFSDLTTGYMGANGASDDEIREASQIFNPIFAAITSGGDQSQFGINSGLNSSLTENNYLNHGEAARRAELLDLLDGESCQGERDLGGACAGLQAELVSLNMIDLARDQALETACGEAPTSNACLMQLQLLTQAHQSYVPFYQNGQIPADGTYGEFLQVASAYGDQIQLISSYSAGEALLETLPMILLGEVPYLGDGIEIANCVNTGVGLNLDCGGAAVTVVPAVGGIFKFIVRQGDTVTTITRNIDSINATNGTGDTVTGYRGVSEKELDDINETGSIRAEPEGRSMEDKWFSETEDGARQQVDMHDDLETVIEVDVPREVYDDSYQHPNIDGTGAGFCVPGDRLCELQNPREIE